MRLAGKNARLGDRGIVLQLDDAARRNVLLAKAMQEFIAAFVVTNHSNRQHVNPEISEVINGVGPASGNKCSLAMLQDQHRRFA